MKIKSIEATGTAVFISTAGRIFPIERAKVHDIKSTIISMYCRLLYCIDIVGTSCFHMMVSLHSMFPEHDRRFF